MNVFVRANILFKGNLKDVCVKPAFGVLSNSIMSVYKLYDGKEYACILENGRDTERKCISVLAKTLLFW